jgi:hypothetical protein
MYQRPLKSHHGHYVTTVVLTPAECIDIARELLSLAQGRASNGQGQETTYWEIEVPGRKSNDVLSFELETT